MSRSDYSDEIEDNWRFIRWRGAVASAIRGKRGQAFFHEMLAALDALPEKKLIANELVAADGCVCALGAVAKARGMDTENLDPHCPEVVASAFGVPETLACEIAYINDEQGYYRETPEQRYERVRKWVESNIRPELAKGDSNA